jgi:hypothetical protein
MDNSISIGGPMEVVGQYDADAAPGGAGVRPSRTTTGGSPRVPGAPVAPPRPSMGLPAEPGTHAVRGPSFADIASLQERIASLEALVRRDEDVLKKLLALIIEKGIATRDEVINRLK